MKVHNVVRYDSDGNGGEKCRVILCFADREKAEERVDHLHRQFSKVSSGGSVHQYPTFHIVTKKVIGEKKIEKEVLKRHKK